MQRCRILCVPMLTLAGVLMVVGCAGGAARGPDAAVVLDTFVDGTADLMPDTIEDAPDSGDELASDNILNDGTAEEAWDGDVGPDPADAADVSEDGFGEVWDTLTDDAADAADVPSDGIDEAGDTADAPSDTVEDTGPPPPVRGWRITWNDEFNGPEARDDPCYDHTITPPMCMNRYWSREPCTAGTNLDEADKALVLSNVAGLNKCVWSIYNIYNWMDWGKPALCNGNKTGINNLDPREVKVENGELVLTAHRITANGMDVCTNWDCGRDLADWLVSRKCPIRAGAIMSQAWNDAANTPGFQQTYGRWEIRAILSDGPGSWPAHWLLPQSACYPEGGEIDIMEATADLPTVAASNLHSGKCDDQTHRRHISPGNWPHDPKDKRFSSDWHVYAAEWEPSQIRFYIDDIEIGRADAGTILMSDISADPDPEQIGQPGGELPLSIPATAFFWILNTSVVPNGGPEDLALRHDMSNFVPLTHRIDYVRVYERCTANEDGCVAERPRARNVTRMPWMSASKWSQVYRVTHTGDFNGDGFSDLLLQTRGPGHATYLILADGQGGLLPDRDINTESGMTQVMWSAQYRKLHMGDFNGDGRTDVLLQPRGPGLAAYLLHANGTGFAPPLTLATAGDNAIWSEENRTLVRGDFDGDGRQDVLLVGNDATLATWLFRGNAAGGFDAPVDMTYRHGMNAARWSIEARKPVAGDFDGNGTTDLILQGRGSNTTLMLRATVGGPDGPFDSVSDVSNLYWMSASKWSNDYREIFVGDYDGDGRDDVLMQPRDIGGNQTYLLIADGTGGFWHEENLTDRYGMSQALWSTTYRVMHTGDFDGNGSTDVLLQSRGKGHASYLLLGDGEGDFTRTDGGFRLVEVITDRWVLSDVLWAHPGRFLFTGDFNADKTTDFLLQATDDTRDTYLVLVDPGMW